MVVGHLREAKNAMCVRCWLPQFQFRVDRGKVFFGSAAERSVGQEGRHTFLNRRVFM